MHRQQRASTVNLKNGQNCRISIRYPLSYDHKVDFQAQRNEDHQICDSKLVSTNIAQASHIESVRLT